MAPKQFTLAEVSQHNTKDDLWLVIHDKVYDVTKFQLEHPGGDEVLIDRAGKDGTAGFDEADHSSSAIEQMATFYLGDVVDAEKVVKSKPEAKSKPQADSNCHYCWFGISAASIALGAIVLYKGYQLAKGSTS